MLQQKTILITAYAINPYKGSEDGMGWHFVCEAARHYRVIAITRENNLPPIRQYLAEHAPAAAANVEFVGFDLPPRKRFWKKGGRGAMLYFYLWQKSLPDFIRARGFSFDLAHNLNFHNDWTPSFLWQLGKPFVWGPIGHHPRIPAAFLKFYGLPALLRDRAAWWVKQASWKFSRELRQTGTHADAILAMNSSIGHIFPQWQHKMHLLPSVGMEAVAQPLPQQQQHFIVLSAGRFVPLKGFDLGIRAFSTFYHRLSERERARCCYVLVGRGPERARLQALAASLGLEQAVRFIPWMERSELSALYARAQVFLFPSHEGAGMVVAEALAHGLPVLCLDNYGPGEFVTDECGLKVACISPQVCAAALGRQLEKLYRQPALRQQLAQGARRRFETHFDWQQKGKILRNIYAQVLGERPEAEIPHEQIIA